MSCSLRLGAFVATVVLAGCASAPPYEPGVRVELALTDEGHQPPVFRWDAPVAARVTVTRGRETVWELAEADRAGRRVPITPPLAYGTRFQGPTGPRAPTPRVLVAPEPLLPGRSYRVTVVGYDGTVFEGRFIVQARVEPAGSTE